MESKKVQRIIGGILIGSAIGILIGALCSSKKGKATQKKLKDNARHWGNNLRDCWAHYKEDFQEGKNRFKHELHKKRENAIDHLAKEYEDLIRK